MFHSRPKSCGRGCKKSLRDSCAAHTANLHWGSLSRRMLHGRCQRRGSSQRIAMGFVAPVRMPLAAVNAPKPLRRARTSERVDSNALWWLSTDRERAREPRDRGPLLLRAHPVRPYHSNMTTRLYLVRHGATELSAEDRFAGALDVAL